MSEIVKGTFIFYCIAFSIACFVLYHSVFRIYYFDLLHGVFKEIICCVLAGVFLAGLAMMFSTYIAIAIAVLGTLFSLKVESPGLRIFCIILSIVLAVFVFITGKSYKQISSSPGNTAPEKINGAASTSQAEQVTASTYSSNHPYSEVPADTYTQVIPEETRSNSYVIGYVVHTNEGLNVRSEPSVQSQLVGRLMPYEEVRIYEQEIYGTSIWGRTDTGWVCMDYISTDPNSVEQAFRDQHTDAFDVGYVHAEGGLNIRSGPGTWYNEVGRLADGECIAIYEYRNDGSVHWGRIDRGWVCTDYIIFE